MRRSLLHFQFFLSGTTVAVFCSTVTEVAYLRKEGGTRSPALNTIVQEILRWAKSRQIRLAPQFIPGICNVLADSLSRPHQLPSSEWSLNMDVCSDRILTCRIKSMRSPAKVGLVVTDLITSPVVSWEGWETPPPPPAPRLCCHSLLNHRRGKTSLLLW